MEKYKDVDSYIANSAEEARPIFIEIRKLIKSTITEAEEGIGWNVPIFKYHGILAGFDATKSYVTFGIDVLESKDREILKEKGYKTGSRTIQIRFDQKVPTLEIVQLLKKQARMNEEMNEAKN